MLKHQHLQKGKSTYQDSVQLLFGKLPVEKNMYLFITHEKLGCYGNECTLAVQNPHHKCDFGTT